MIQIRILALTICMIFFFSVCGLCQEDSVKLINSRISFKKQQGLTKELLDTIGIIYLGKKKPLKINQIIVWSLRKHRAKKNYPTFNFFYASPYLRVDISISRKKYSQYYFVDERLIKINDRGLYYEPSQILLYAREYFERGLTLLKPN